MNRNDSPGAKSFFPMSKNTLQALETDGKTYLEAVMAGVYDFDKKQPEWSKINDLSSPIEHAAFTMSNMAEKRSFTTADLIANSNEYPHAMAFIDIRSLISTFSDDKIIEIVRKCSEAKLYLLWMIAHSCDITECIPYEDEHDEHRALYNRIGNEIAELDDHEQGVLVTMELGTGYRSPNFFKKLGWTNQYRVLRGSIATHIRDMPDRTLMFDRALNAAVKYHKRYYPYELVQWGLKFGINLLKCASFRQSWGDWAELMYLLEEPHDENLKMAKDDITGMHVLKTGNRTRMALPKMQCENFNSFPEDIRAFMKLVQFKNIKHLEGFLVVEDEDGIVADTCCMNLAINVGTELIPQFRYLSRPPRDGLDANMRKTLTNMLHVYKWFPLQEESHGASQEAPLQV